MNWWNNLSNEGKGFVAIGLIVVVVFGFLFTVVPMSYRNTIADNEVAVANAKDACAVQIDNGAKAIIQVAQVDINTKQFIAEIFEKAAKDPNSELGRKVDEAYVQFVGGNTNPMMVLMSGLAGTDITASAQAVQREISAQRSIMTSCSVNLIGSQNALKNTLGWDASGRTVKFPQKLFKFQPSTIPDPSLRDNDFDGRITVLDYRPPVDVAVMNSFGTGEAPPLENPYGNP